MFHLRCRIIIWYLICLFPLPKHLAGWFGTFFMFPYIWNLIIPTDFLTCFRGVGLNHQPAILSQQENFCSRSQELHSRVVQLEAQMSVGGWFWIMGYIQSCPDLNRLRFPNFARKSWRKLKAGQFWRLQPK